MDKGGLREDQTSLQRTTLMYDYTIILLEPLHRSSLSPSPLLSLNTHFRL